ncbi:unnamed protein product [Rhizoctonia solani]|uniref:Uncharacterized protein n=2 Tax=Rhizoctonia solani TaxID=456999 RepID=A0A8H2X908_9AGAM|nr:unnamed protein product [Rhizoctonia solani]
MSRKTGSTTSLSNGTLSLRFMQRGTAQRVAATTAKIVDEAEWDIGPVARAAWGVTLNTNQNSTAESSIHVTQDDSYLPFVFEHDTPDATEHQHLRDESEAEPGRRRIFRHGTEVKHDGAPPVEAVDPSSEPTKPRTSTGSNPKDSRSPKAFNPQPKFISGSRAPLNDDEVANKAGIRRHRLEGLLKRSDLSSSGFLKPAGVSSASSTSTKRAREDNIAPLRGKVKRSK